MTRIVSLVCTHAIEIARVFLPLIANMLFFSIKFSLQFNTTQFPGPAERIFKWGGGGATRGVRGPREILKLKPSEMARNGSKTAKSEVNF